MKGFAVLAASFLVAACGTSAEPEYYNLAAVDGKTVGSIATVIKVQRPSLAGYLDRPDLVSQDGDYQVHIDESRQWAQPLDVMVEGLLASNLRQRLPKSTVVTDSDAQSGDVRFVIEVDIEKFNAVSGREVDLQGAVAIIDKKNPAPPKSQPVRLSAMSGGSMDDLAEGMSALIGQLADQTVSLLENTRTKTN